MRLLTALVTLSGVAFVAPLWRLPSAWIVISTGLYIAWRELEWMDVPERPL